MSQNKSLKVTCFTWIILLVVCFFLVQYGVSHIETRYKEICTCYLFYLNNITSYNYFFIVQYGVSHIETQYKEIRQAK